MSSVVLTAPPRARLIALRVVAVLYALLTALASFGLPSLVTAWSTSGEELPLRTAYVAWGVLAGLLIPALALSLFWRPRVGGWRALVALVAGAAVAMALAFEKENLGYAAVIVGPALVLLLLHPHVREWRRQSSVDTVALSIAVAMAIPAVWYGADLATQSRASSYLDTMHGQYAQGAVLAFALVFMSLVGAVKDEGRLLVVATVSLSTAILGVAGLLFPGDAMSLGTSWGLVALVVAAAYAVAAIRDSRR